MRRIKYCLWMGMLLLGMAACGGSGNDPVVPEPDPTPTPTPDPEPDPDPTPDPEPDTALVFYRGADISWITEMEKDGVKFYRKDGTEVDGFVLMKELGMNAIRLRVWVNPAKSYGPFCDQADVVAKAQRAKAAGMEVMIDFHYSDFFADPGKQTVPADWNNQSLNELKASVKTHTTAVLQALKQAEVSPRWIQIGNETKNGMLWPHGQLWNEQGNLANGWKNYAQLSNAGYEAAKAVFADACVLVHLNNAWEELEWWFTDFKKAGGKFDMIGLSHYPQAESDKTWKQVNQLAISHIQSLAKANDCQVMVCEVGVKTQANEAVAAQALKAFMDAVTGLEDCAGVFYWEPMVYGGWKPAYYTTLNWNSYDMGAFTANGKPSQVMEVLGGN